MFVSLRQNFKNSLPSIPMQQIFITEVRNEKFGITSQRSPTRACRVSQREHQWYLTTVLMCDDSRARFSQDGYRPILEADFCRNTSLVHCAIVIATTTNPHHCYQQTKMTLIPTIGIPAIPLIPALILLTSSAGSHNPILVPWVTVIPGG